MLRQAASEISRTAPDGTRPALVRARLTHEDVRRFQRRLKPLVDDFRAPTTPEASRTSSPSRSRARRDATDGDDA